MSILQPTSRTLGVGGTAQRGLNGHGYPWDEDHTIVPLAVGAKVALGDDSGDGVVLFSVGVTFMKNFELARFGGAIVESKEEELKPGLEGCHITFYNRTWLANQ
ncbi:hypothetical protein V6N13_047813 [Hibiscus sabdariffa]